MVVFKYIYEHIKKSGNKFDEKQINELIEEKFDDFVTMRRYLIDYGYLKRDKYGKEYTVRAGEKNEQNN